MGAFGGFGKKILERGKHSGILTTSTAIAGTN
jgi:hypothetical protein